MPKRRSHEEVKAEFERKQYILLEDKYINNKQKMLYKCKNHPEIEQRIRFNDLMMGHGCRICGEERKAEHNRKKAESQRHLFENVKKEFKDRGFILIDKSYESAKKHIRYKCESHLEVEQKIRYADFKSGNGCKYCAIDARKLSTEHINRIFAEKGYELTEETYINAGTAMKFNCPRHKTKETRISITDLKGGHGCRFCAIELSSGENSVHYNHNLSEEERKYDRRYDPLIHKFRREVFNRDNYKCVMCGVGRSGTLNAHHKDGFNWREDRRYDINNGATLCKTCHVDFHSKYGFGGNTEKQFNQWLDDKKEAIR
jgi:hypothetical protein